ncbi:MULTISPECIES: YdeI/OmpD-associated family protein [unclassified Clostridium]|uniref:YdeI/OmpD-associated family protein n=1 Tax=unclassified Clostridium TaxID=2614128 RepID=UPI000EE10CA0|nr:MULTISPECIES: YdeI/OmpD-associated family protein [unclassified Clostridium]HCQ91452.1 hypothetical protein [Clostridium sp.]
MSDKNFIGMGHNPNPNVPDIPEGFAMALLQEPDARASFQNLSDEQKTNVIQYIQNNNLTGTDAKNKINSAIKNLNNNSIDFI